MDVTVFLRRDWEESLNESLVVKRYVCFVETIVEK